MMLKVNNIYHLKQMVYQKSGNQNGCGSCRYKADAYPGKKMLCRFGPDFETSLEMTCKAWKQQGGAA